MLKANLKQSLVSLFILLSLGCGKSIQPLNQISDQTQFLKNVQTSNPQINTLKAKVRIEVVTKDKTYNFKAGLMMTNTAQLFLETYGLGVPQGYVSLLNDKLTAIFPGDKEMYVGTGSSPIRKMLKINLTINELFDPVLKKIVVSEDAPPKITVASNHYLIRDADENEFYVNANNWIDKIERRMGYLVEYGNPISSKTKFPKSVRLSFEKQSIQMTFDDVVINQPLAYEAFQINIPSEGFHVSPIE